MQSEVLNQVNEPELRMYITWVPILPDDSEAAARGSSSLVPDERAKHFWDAHGVLPPTFARLLALPDGTPAWDVYLAYPRGVRWDDVPPAPAVWHHQLGDQPSAPVLDGKTFAEHVRRLLSV